MQREDCAVVMTWDEVVTKHHHRHAAMLGILPDEVSYAHTRTIKRMPEAV